jgi:hypothetical protein
MQQCWTAGDPSRKTACVFKNPENAGMVRKISFQMKSYLFNLQEMFKNSGSGHMAQSNIIVCLEMWDLCPCLL